MLLGITDFTVVDNLGSLINDAQRMRRKEGRQEATRLVENIARTTYPCVYTSVDSPPSCGTCR